MYGVHRPARLTQLTLPHVYIIQYGVSWTASHNSCVCAPLRMHHSARVRQSCIPCTYQHALPERRFDVNALSDKKKDKGDDNADAQDLAVEGRKHGHGGAREADAARTWIVPGQLCAIPAVSYGLS